MIPSTTSAFMGIVAGLAAWDTAVEIEADLQAGRSNTPSLVGKGGSLIGTHPAAGLLGVEPQLPMDSVPLPALHHAHRSESFVVLRPVAATLRQVAYSTDVL